MIGMLLGRSVVGGALVGTRFEGTFVWKVPNEVVGWVVVDTVGFTRVDEVGGVDTVG